ncbi:hypothetical protein HNP98_003307 [Hymenobacter sp. 9A]|uniref:Uncharacterized protein n=1 Tax=Hymenobacter caeli TaxID=2735894 RepID=A0ABX2FVX1_9BACT|nr:hypothetical protein [Hymenobacter caeli]
MRRYKYVFMYFDRIKFPDYLASGGATDGRRRGKIRTLHDQFP